VRVTDGVPSIADEDTVEEHHLDIEAGRHFDDRLVLLARSIRYLETMSPDWATPCKPSPATMSEGESVGRWPFTLTVGEVR
jgi:hypothetical protein